MRTIIDTDRHEAAVSLLNISNVDIRVKADSTLDTADSVAHIHSCSEDNYNKTSTRQLLEHLNCMEANMSSNLIYREHYIDTGD